MSTSPRLNLPYIAPQQAQKQVTYNAAISALDQLVQPAVLSTGLSAPPATPEVGDCYAIAPTGSAAWAARDHQLATWDGTAWQFRAPGAGWLAYDLDAGQLALFDGAGWVRLVSPGGAEQPWFGINTEADSTNRLAVAADGSRFGHDGSDHRLTIDKSADTDTASVVFQSAGSGRAELGLTGDADLHVKVSADGAGWTEALSIDSSGGVVSLPQGQLAFPATQNPSSDANTLDDYEEGSWTPTLAFGGTSTGITYSTQVGRYTKIGRLVYVACSIVLTSKGSATGAATVTGFPHTVANDGLTRSGMVGFASGFSSVTGAVIATLPPNNTRFSLYQSVNGSGGAITNSNFGNSTQLHVSGVYEV